MRTAALPGRAKGHSSTSVAGSELKRTQNAAVNAVSPFVFVPGAVATLFAFCTDDSANGLATLMVGVLDVHPAALPNVALAPKPDWSALVVPVPSSNGQ